MFSYYIPQSMTKEIANSIRDSDAEHAGLVEAVHNRVMARIVQQGDVAGQVHEAPESKRYSCFTTSASVTRALLLLLPPTYYCFTTALPLLYYRCRRRLRASARS